MSRLGSVAGEAVVRGALLAALKDDDEDVRSAAATALWPLAAQERGKHERPARGRKGRSAAATR